MKKIILTMVAIILAACVITLCGCETTIKLEEDTTLSGSVSQKYEDPTIIVAVTNEEGTVVSTETVTMSQQDKEEEKNFFKPIVQSNVSTGVSADRVQQALQNQQVLQSQTTNAETENNAPDINNTTSSNGSSSTPNVPYVQDDSAVLRSNQYMINVRLVDSAGVAQNYKIAKNGKTSSVSMVYNDVPMAVILGEETWYLLSVSDKTYIEIPKETIEASAEDEEFKDMLMGDPFDFNREIVSKSTETEDGITYNVVEYDNGNKDYFIGKTLIKTTAEDDSVMYYDSISPIAPMSLFTPPADYKKTVVTEENASDIAGAVSPNSVEESTDSDNE